MPKILAFAGCLKKDSNNQKLVKIAATGAAHNGADITLIDLTQFPLPVFNEDVEETDGIPDNALKLKTLMMSHDGFLISTPEYNCSYSSALKNMMDWVSCKNSPGEPNYIAYRGKTAGIMSVSEKGLGGIKGLIALRVTLTNLGVKVIPNQPSIYQHEGVFNLDGTLQDKNKEKMVIELGSQLTRSLIKLHA